MDITVLPAIDEKEFSKLYSQFSNITMRKMNDNGRRGFPSHRACIFGMTKPRYTNKIQLAAYSRKYPEIHDEIMRLGELISPDGFSFNSVQVNRNICCPKHRDSKNVGLSILVSFGEYTGCNIVIEGTEYNAKYQPVMFNGALLEHWNTEDLIGDKYSLVFFTCKV